MKRMTAIILAGVLVSALTACTDNSTKETGVVTESQTNDSAATAEAAEQNGKSGKVLIAYFALAENSDVDAVSSASNLTMDGEVKGMTQAVADWIQEETGGDLFSIQSDVTYPAGGEEVIEQAEQEQEDDIRPELTAQIENLDEYDTIFIGYPLWWYDLPQIMYSFFDEYDFSGKTIIPFSTHNGSRFSGTIETIQELEPDAAVSEEGLTISQNDVEDSQDDVIAWLESMGF